MDNSSRLTARDIKAIHTSSKIGVLVSIIWLFLGLVFASLGEYWLHFLSITGGVLAGFVSSVASSYIVSGLRGKSISAPSLAKLLLLVAPIAASTSPILGVLFGLEAYSLYLALAIFIQSIPALIAAKTSKMPVRASFIGIGVSSTVAGLYQLAGIYTGLVYDYLWFFLGFLYSYPILMIYSVSVNSFPSTYGLKPVTLLYYSSMALVIGGLWLLLAYSEHSFTLFSISLATYFSSIRIHEAPRIYREKIKPAKHHVVLKTHEYFLAGHVFALALAVLVVIYYLSFSQGLFDRLDCLIHATAIGFIGIHIYIHAPLMLPVILGIPTARRYNILPYLFLGVAASSFCIERKTTLILLIASLILLATIAVPARRRSQQSA